MAEDVGSGSRIVNPEWLARVNEQTTRPSSGGGGSSDRAIIPGPEQPGYREIVGRGSSFFPKYPQIRGCYLSSGERHTSK